MRRGFTIVELMVALSGGLVVSLAVFALARDTSRFYQRESRLANATLGAIGGFQRLRDDIARAGFMTSPNAKRDPFVCSRPDASWPLEMQGMASVHVEHDFLQSNATLNAALRHPDRITLSGSYASADQFPVRQIINNGNSYNILLDPTSAAMYRINYPSGQLQATLQTVFAVDRALRIVDVDGQQYFGHITGAAGGPQPTITLGASPALSFRQNSGSAGCGIKAYGTGALVNVVNFVRYDVRNLSANTTYSNLYSASAGVLGEDTRTELARVEVDVNGNPLPLTEELVAEYAVDLQFSLSAMTTPVTGGNATSATYYAPGATGFTTYADSPSANPAATPELIRSIRVRLGVRSREADRDQQIAAPAATSGLYRLDLNGSGGAGSGSSFARVRTFQGEIALTNQSRVTW
jgi:hypothetical protein